MELGERARCSAGLSSTKVARARRRQQSEMVATRVVLGGLSSHRCKLAVEGSDWAASLGGWRLEGNPSLSLSQWMI
ncbi:hypothetical protein PanWU01x14_217050 [Parasponia andersonii]|uniref:Uncharacterized protein n=1 Tax=Parasponia andersonii TaxID=3476 RepID=A0A2P5BRB5_PARAD|nr:hypothetical protein PanWU01x14_217050 [Parasponia andersonii]